jgi:hypothetical protein
LYYAGVVAERQGRADDAAAFYRAAADEARAAGKTALADDAQRRMTTVPAGH